MVVALNHVLLRAAGADPLLWYITRAMAIMAYIAMALVVMIGQIRVIVRKLGDPIPWVLDEVHIFLSILALVFVAGHLITLLIDPFLSFSLQNLIIPGDQPYRPLAVNIGVLSVYALVIVMLSSWLRRALPYSWWRNLHNLSFVLFILVSLHGILAGSDNAEPFMLTMYLAASLVVGGMLLTRACIRPTRHPHPLKSAV